MAQLTQDQIRSLDQVRTRLLTLRATLAKLHENLVTSQPLPSVSSLQISANVVSSSLQTIAEQLAEHQELFASTLVFPLPQFPGRTQGHILTDTLLRTKLEPSIEQWVQQGEELAKEQNNSSGISEGDRNKLWRWAPEAANREARKQKWGADYTLAEVRAGVENVITGLSRELVEPDDDEEDADGDEEEDQDEYEDESDGEPDEADKMNVEGSTNGPGGTSTSVVEAEGMSPIAGRPAYLETLQEFMTTGRVQRYEPLLVEQRREAEQKKQSTQSI